MATTDYGVIRDDETLTPDKLGDRLGRSSRWVKDYVREQDIRKTDLGNGLWQITGLNWRLAMERIASTQMEDDS